MHFNLPAWLDERTRIVQPSATDAPKSGYVLYWMRYGMRTDENPALAVALTVAHQSGQPLLVYQDLSSESAYASDRHHAFVLQGARGLQEGFAKLGIRYAVHCQTAGSQRQIALVAGGASVLITEEMPTPEASAELLNVSRHVSIPVLAVDTACVVPMKSLGRKITRAFEFRNVTQKEFRERVRRDWPSSLPNATFYDGPLPCASLDLAVTNLNDLIARCDVDHSVPPVSDTRGGSAAGYQRWQDFKAHHLAAYASRRNDAADNGVSRMSAYLHYGMVSPFRIVREAVAHQAEKYVDELFVWRELAYNFCFYFDGDLDSFSALPEWARAALAARVCDKRPQLYTWEDLARAQTDSPLWNACQRSLVKHGELHNNVRMTWGKQILHWVKDPEDALACAIDLNHRYALDGNDPCSYGGILWCFGQFDRPFAPEQEIFGTVRTRPVEDHARRLDIAAYERRVDRPIADHLPTVAVIGAGIGGLTAARQLSDLGLTVTVFEKSRGVGGRVATRRTDSGAEIDHGAQYFTAYHPHFQRLVESWVSRGVVARWDGEVVTFGPIKNDGMQKSDPVRYVGVPSMNQLARHLAHGLSVEREVRIRSLLKRGNAWTLEAADDRCFGPFDLVIVNTPPEQAAALVPTGTSFFDQITAVKMEPCWSVLLELASPIKSEFAGAFVNDGPLSWVALNDSKPGRRTASAWTLHASAAWSEAHINVDRGFVIEELTRAFGRLVGGPITAPVYAAAHLWRYAKPHAASQLGYLYDSNDQIGVCGDWCAGARVEGAYLSGMALAGGVARALTAHRS